MATFTHDLTFALRSLRKSIGFAAAAVLVLALGIGANSAIFSVVNSVLLRPLPFESADRIVKVSHTPPPQSFPGVTTFSVSPANFLDWQKQNHVFESMAPYQERQWTLSGDSSPEPVMSGLVGIDFFSILRAKPVAGRVFLPEEGEPGHNQVIVLSNAFWQSHFGGNRDAIGRQLSFNGQSYTVVGVMPASFHLPAWGPAAVDVWAPLGWTDKDRAVRNNHNYNVVARLKPGVSLEQAQAEMNTISKRLEMDYPEDNKGWGAIIIPLHENLVGEVRPALLVLLGAVGFVLLIACANVANLVLARTLGRRKEISIRAALGASRRRVLQQVVTETLILALTGGALGLFIAHFGVKLIVAFLASKLPRATEAGLDTNVLLMTLLTSIATGVVAGVIPAWRLTQGDLNEGLKRGLSKTDSDSSGNNTRSILVAAEVALSLVLLMGAGLTLRSLTLLNQVDPGLNPHNVLTLTVSVPKTRYPLPNQQVAFFDQALESVRTLPGVVSAGLTDTLPLSDGGSMQPFAIEGRPAVRFSEQPEVAVRQISPGYFKTMGVPLKRGRDVGESDRLDRPGVVVISESMAKQFWPNEDPIGKRLVLSFFPGVWREVVGVVGDVKDRGLDSLEPVATLYWPFAQSPSTGMSMAIRTQNDPNSIVSGVTNALRAIDRELPVRDVMTMDAIVAESLSQRRFTMLLLAAFAGLALLLAGAGIYSVLSYAVNRRMREIGIRIALGGKTADMFRLVLSDALRPAAAGAVIGLVAAFLLKRVLETVVFGVSAVDPLTLIATLAVLAIAAVTASAAPVMRASRVDPIRVLREE